MADVTLRAQAELESAKQQLAELQQALADLGEETEQEGEQTEGLNVGLANLMMGLSVVKTGLGMLEQAYSGTIGKTMEWADSVDGLARDIGATTEEASKLAVAAGDVGIGADKLGSALAIATKNGVDVSIAGIGQLADQYNAIQDPLERTRFLMDTFGKSGREMGELMEQGSTGIKALGDQAEATGLVLTDQTIESAKQAKIAMAQFKDATDGLVVSLTKDLIPGLTNAAQAAELLLTWTGRISGGWQQQNDQLAKNTQSYDEYLAAVIKNIAAHEKWDDLYTARILGTLRNGGTEAQRLQQIWGIQSETIFGQTHKLGDYADRLAGATAATKTHIASEADQAYALKLGNDALADRYQAMGNQYEQTGPLTAAEEKLTNDLIAQRYAGYAAADATRDQAGADMQATEAANLYQVAIGGAMANELDNFNRKQSDLTQTSQDLQDKIDKLSSKPWLSETQRAQLDEYKNKLGENQQAVKDNAAEHDKATKKIILGYFEQAMAANGTSLDEQAALMKIAQSYGLIDSASVTAFENAQKAVANYNTSGDVDKLILNADRAAKGLGAVSAASESIKPPPPGLATIYEQNAIKVNAVKTAAEQTATSDNWRVAQEKIDTTKQKTEGLQTAQDTQAQTQATKLAAQATDPNWKALQDQVAATQKAFDDLAYSIRSMPDHKTITIITKYITEGSGIPTSVAANAGP